MITIEHKKGNQMFFHTKTDAIRTDDDWTPQPRSLWRKTVDFVKEVVIAAKDKVVDFVVGVYRHTEGIIILSLASMGLATLLSRIPFMLALPLWVEASMFIPVVAVLCVLLLSKSAEVRSRGELA